MSTSPKCRAQGGPANCTDPNCPERQAFINELQSANAGKYDRKFLDRNLHESKTVDSMQLDMVKKPSYRELLENPNALVESAHAEAVASLTRDKEFAAAEADADVAASQERRVRRARRTRPTLESPSERIAFNSVKKGDYVSLDDHGSLTPPVKVIKMENNDGYNVKVTYQSSNGDMVLSTTQWYTTPITRYAA